MPRKSKIHIHKNELIPKYISGMSPSALGEIYGVDRSTIERLLLLEGVTLRTRSEASIARYKRYPNTIKLDGLDDQIQIIQKYKNSQSMISIAKDYNVSTPIIRRILNNHHIQLRTPSQNSKIQFANYNKVSDSLLSMINGWLLGDGSLEGHNQACFRLVSKHEEYIDFAISKFKKEAFYCNKYKTYIHKTKKYYWRLTSCSTYQFKSLKEKWYPEGRKIVPKDLSLSGDLIKCWIMDDGTLSKVDGSMVLCTHGFTKKDCEFLTAKINEFIGFDCAKINKDGKYYKIRIGRVGTNRLFDIIGECMVDCFNYKWERKVL